MFLLKVHQNLILILALMSGIVITISFAVGALDMRQERPPAGSKHESKPLSTRSAMPWFVIASTLVILALGIIYTVATILTPPNW